jgi:drug/metabolite transporter (DMT)-like permease
MIGRLELMLAALLWAGNYAVGRIIADEISPLALTFLRWVVALLLLFPFVISRLPAAIRLVGDNLGWFVSMSLTAVVLHPILIYTALNYTTATNMALIIAATPAMMLILSMLIHGERYGLFRIAVVSLSFAAIAILVWGTLSTPNAGDLLGCLAMVVWAYYNVSLRECPIAVDGITLTTAIIVIGVVVMAPLFIGELALTGPVRFSNDALLSILYVGLFASGLAHLLWNRGVARVGPINAGQFMNLVPIFGVLIGTFILNEHFSWRHALAAALIVTSLVLSELRGKEGMTTIMAKRI